MCFLTVSPVCLLDAPIVGDIFPLSIDTVERLVNKRMSVVAVLPYDTIGSLQEVILGLLLPPVGQVSWSTSAQIKLTKSANFLPFLSNCLPRSSNPWVISCPMTQPMAP